MDSYIQGVITGAVGATGLISMGLSVISLLKNRDTQPIIMEKVTIPSGGKAYGKKDPSKRTPKALTELIEWQAEQDKGE